MPTLRMRILPQALPGSVGQLVLPRLLTVQVVQLSVVTVVHYVLSWTGSSAKRPRSM